MDREAALVRIRLRLAEGLQHLLLLTVASMELELAHRFRSVPQERERGVLLLK